MLYNTLYKSYDDIYSLQRYLWKKYYSRRIYDQCTGDQLYFNYIYHISNTQDIVEIILYRIHESSSVFARSFSLSLSLFLYLSSLIAFHMHIISRTSILTH